MIVFAMPGNSGAWFSEHKDPRSFFRRADFDFFQSPGSLAVYDDIAKGPGRILIPSNDFFIPVDTIDLDIPLTFLSQAPVSPMDALERLMAANLRVKLLIDEYNALQKRADELLKSLSIPYLDSPWQPADRNGVKSLYEQKKHLETKINGVLVQGHVLNHKKFDFVNSSAIGLQPGGVVQSSISPKNPNHAPPRVTDGTQGVLPEISPLSTVSSEKELPWIFAFFINATSYCLSHRLEAVFYGLFLFFFGYLITLQARHGK